MEPKAKVLFVYSLVVLLGGVIGYVFSNSIASLISSSFFGLVLLGCTIEIKRGKLWAFYAAQITIAILLLFFTYRFYLTLRIFPAGVFAFLSALVLIYFISKKRSGDVIKT